MVDQRNLITPWRCLSTEYSISIINQNKKFLSDLTQTSNQCGHHCVTLLEMHTIKWVDHVLMKLSDYSNMVDDTGTSSHASSSSSLTYFVGRFIYFYKCVKEYRIKKKKSVNFELERNFEQRPTLAVNTNCNFTSDTSSNPLEWESLYTRANCLVFLVCHFHNTAALYQIPSTDTTHRKYRGQYMCRAYQNSSKQRNILVALSAQWLYSIHQTRTATFSIGLLIRWL